MVAKTFQGLEEVLRDELIALGAENVEIGRRMVSFEGDLEMLYKANLCCRTALRILKPILKFTATNPDELYDEVRDIDWEQFMSLDSTFAIDSTVNSAEFTHSKFVTYRVKDGIADHFNDKYGRRPSIRLSGADLMLNVHIIDDRVTISLDSSGEPLSKRGYRTEAVQAPLNEVLAAGIILKTGWRGDCNFVDPMCGSGTFLIEAALIAANINPGIYRENFAFERWPDFDRELFERLYNDDSGERDFNYKIYGADIDPEAVGIAMGNIRRARVENMIELSCKAFTDWTEAPQPGILITNPPYGERLKPDDISALYKGIGSELKNVFKGYHAWILGYADENFANIGLRPSVKFPILNGALECSLREYVLFDGSYADFKTGGGSIHNEDFNRGERVKMRHVSDREWKEETRKFRKNRDDEQPGRKSFRDRKDRDKREYRDRGERREFSGRDRKDFREKERGEFREKRDFKAKGERKDFRDKREFRDKKDFRDKKEFRENKEFRAPRRDRNGALNVRDTAPSLPESSEIVFSKVPIRSRRSFKEKMRERGLQREIGEQDID